MAFDVSGLVADLDNSDELWMNLTLGGDTAQFLKEFSTKKDTFKLPTFQGDRDIFQNSKTCALTPTGNDDFTEEAVTLASIGVLKEYCLRDLENFYTSDLLPAGQNYTEALRISFEETTRQIVAQNEINTWLGDTGGSGSLALQDGFVKLIGTTNAAKAITGTRISFGPITDTTALGFVEGLVDAIMNVPDLSSAAASGELELYISPQNRRDYDINYRTTFGDTTHATDFNEDFVQGTNIRFRVVGGLTGADFMCITPKDNLSQVVDLSSDESTITAGLDEFENNVWIKTVFKKGYGARNYSQIAFHRLLT